MNDTPIKPHLDTVIWDDKGQPLSTLFDDIYFSKANGLEESRYIFLQHNQLKERFLSLSPNDHFIIAETGFGTGLNFIACWQLWHSIAPPSCRLHYIAVEKYPLPPVTRQQSLKLWPELSDYNQQLHDAYQKSYIGQEKPHIQRLTFDNIQLTLIIDGAEQGLKKLLGSQHPDLPSPYWKTTNRGVDAWFFDGFAPSKNPEMWTEQLFITAAHLSHKASTFATFTAAGLAKRNLLKAGFIIKKVPGFANKREMLTGSLNSQASIPSISTTVKKTPPWSTIRHYKPASTQQKIAVIGAGIAGCHSAYALAKRGFTVTVIDRNPQLAQGASGNPQGILYAKLSTHEGVLGDFNLAALLYAQQFYHTYWQDTGRTHQTCGVLQLAYTKKLEKNYASIGKHAAQTGVIDYLSPSDASHIAKHTIQHHALYFPYCGWLQPVELCHWLLQHPNITLITNTNITELHNQPQQDRTYWQLKSPSSSLTIDHLYDHVIIANAFDASSLKQTHWLPIKPIRGQISYINTTPSLSSLQTVVCGQGYIAPSIMIGGETSHTIGASFNLNNNSHILSANDHQQNRQQLLKQLPQLHTHQDSININGGRVGFRCSSNDYLPIVGAVPNTQKFKQDFYPLSKNANKNMATTGQYLPHLYTNIAHGSRGLAYTPLSAEILASMIAGEPPPVSQTMLEALNPARFLIRALIKSSDYPK